MIVEIYGSLGVPTMPEPNIASTMTSELLISNSKLSKLERWPSQRFEFEIHKSDFGVAKGTIVQPIPRDCNIRAATYPSPPLFPDPQRNKTFLEFGQVSKIKSDIAIPALFINV